jgi:O-succinylbenzoate synthase
MQITGVDTRVVRWPIESRGAARGQWTDRVALVVAVRTDDGATGLGEAAPLPGMSIDTIADAALAAAELAGRLPLGLDSPAHATGIADRVIIARSPDGAPAARFAIETALLTALAQRRRTSVAALWSAMPHGELQLATVVDDIAEARIAIAHGSRCLKIKAMSPDRVLRIARAVPGVRLRVDANRSWPRAETVRWLQQLAPLDIDYVEEPCLDAHELLRERLPCRIALDESLILLERADLERALTSPDLAALVLKPTLLGGFSRCLELAALAHRHGVAPVVTHALEGPIGTAACFELARAIGADVPVGLAPHPGLDRFVEAA